ncbi:malate synthase G [Nocardia sp. NPDC005745]|uniref:malate synthase G n=1 Tax=Nocardia sp. NPDC005745 TaxID=3157061 RepID=UPI0033EC7EAD
MSTADIAADKWVRIGGLQVASTLRDFVELEAIPGTDIDAATFWAGAERLIADLVPRNRELLARRDDLQRKLDVWHAEHRGENFDAVDYRAFLTEIGYLVAPPAPFTVDTANTDVEITHVAGPQLLVPIIDEAFALEGVNARWGSLYRALYETDAIPADGFADRKRAVIDYTRSILDTAAPLVAGSHADSTCYSIEAGTLQIQLIDGTHTGLAPDARLIGFQGDPASPSAVLIEHHGLHIEIRIDPSAEFGQIDSAGVQDVVLESGISTIMDFEDCVAAVDVSDKVQVYRSWLSLMKGSFASRRGSSTMNPDRRYTGPDGSQVTLHGRALLFARIVGPLMTTNAVRCAQGAEVPELILDALITTLAALHDLRGNTSLANSRNSAVYLAVPKQHGPEEFAFTDELFGRIEQLLGLPKYTLKLGMLDEERRTTVNLSACLAAVRHRVVSTNNGLLDRTGDEIHTSMAAGPMVRKADMNRQRWQQSFEEWHVDTCLAHGLSGRALIGLGMWPTPDSMHELLQRKIGQLTAGAGTSWVPTADAAILHVLHYHWLDVVAQQRKVAADGPRRSLDDLLQLPVAQDLAWTAAEKQAEVDAHCYTILAYVVRWIEQAVASSPMPSINGVVVLEDRATLRMSTQLLANWLHHHVITERDVLGSLRRMAALIDDRHRDDPGYRPLVPQGETTITWRTAYELIAQGVSAPNGYTEPLLYRRRREYKARTDRTPVELTRRGEVCGQL